MTKMSKAQRDAIIEAHRHFKGYVVANRRTLKVLRRESWTRELDAVTTAGLVAAGVDMAAIEAEALDEDRERWEQAHPRTLAIVDRLEVQRLTARRPTLAELEQPAPCGQRWVAEIQRCPRCGLTAGEHKIQGV